MSKRNQARKRARYRRRKLWNQQRIVHAVVQEIINSSPIIQALYSVGVSPVLPFPFGPFDL